MKPFSLNHFQLVPTDSKHNLFHWLTVVLFRAARFAFFTFLGAYLIATGFSLSAQIVGEFLPNNWSEKIASYSFQLPYFQVIQEKLFTYIGPGHQMAPVWWTMVIGLPLILIGISLFLMNLFNLYFALFSLDYNKTHCFFCQSPIEIKERSNLKLKNNASKRNSKT